MRVGALSLPGEPTPLGGCTGGRLALEAEREPSKTTLGDSRVAACPGGTDGLAEVAVVGALPRPKEPTHSGVAPGAGWALQQKREPCNKALGDSGLAVGRTASGN
eukprot:13517072-Alexandrium_andersonii.AAC.1